MVAGVERLDEAAIQARERVFQDRAAGLERCAFGSLEPLGGTRQLEAVDNGFVLFVEHMQRKRAHFHDNGVHAAVLAYGDHDQRWIVGDLRHPRGDHSVLFVAFHRRQRVDPIRETRHRFDYLILHFDLLSLLIAPHRLRLRPLRAVLSQKEGRVSEITFVPPDAYFIAASIDAVEARINLIGKEDAF